MTDKDLGGSDAYEQLLNYLRKEPAQYPAHAEDRVAGALRQRGLIRGRDPQRRWHLWQALAAACVIFATGTAVGGTLVLQTSRARESDSFVIAAHAYLNALRNGSRADSADAALLGEVFRTTADRLMTLQPPSDVQHAARYTLRTTATPVSTSDKEAVVWF